MIAKSGVYDSVKGAYGHLRDVHVKSPQYDVRLKSANIDFKSGVYVSKEPVIIVTSNGTTCRPIRFRASDNGKELTLEGHVKTMIPPAVGRRRYESPDAKGGNP